MKLKHPDDQSWLPKGELWHLRHSIPCRSWCSLMGQDMTRDETEEIIGEDYHGLPGVLVVTWEEIPFIDCQESRVCFTTACPGRAELALPKTSFDKF